MNTCTAILSLYLVYLLLYAVFMFGKTWKHADTYYYVIRTHADTQFFSF